MTFADQPLEEQIAQWRAYVRSRQGLHGPDTEELEGHLRDQLAALDQSRRSRTCIDLWRFLFRSRASYGDRR
jgi:hypothetical protein